MSMLLNCLCFNLSALLTNFCFFFQMFGLPGLICSMSISLTSFERQPLEFYGPKGLRKFLRTSLQISRAHLNFNYMVHELIPHSCQLPEDYKVIISIFFVILINVDMQSGTAGLKFGLPGLICSISISLTSFLPIHSIGMGTKSV